jgi:hypothetical protein
MGGANGSRECAPDDELRDNHHIVVNVSVAWQGDGFCKCSTHPTGDQRSRFEKRQAPVIPNNLPAIRRALEEAGVEFNPVKGGKGVGVRLEDGHG